VRKVHGDDLPSDWIYEEARAACEALDAGELEYDDDVHAHADGRVDIYTRELFAWSAAMCGTSTWSAAEDEAEELGIRGGTEERLRVIQFCAIRSIAVTILAAARSQSHEEAS
jgi:hypothetical protein